MPAPLPEFVTHCIELLAPLGRVRPNRMFGGWGLYVDELFIAIVAFDRLYLKVDAETDARFAQAGCAPFEYTRDGGKVASLNYRTAPDEAMESPALMQPWARLAVAAALRARAAKPVPRPKAAKKAAAEKTAAKKASAKRTVSAKRAVKTSTR